ncbi:MAG: tetratricopeptide repeat protein, partial [Methanolinea sp.]
MAASIANRPEQAKREPDWPKMMLPDPRTRPVRVLVVLLLLLAPLGASADDLADAQRQGAALLRAGKAAEAVAPLARALDLAEARHGPDSPEISADLNNLGEAQRLLGRLDAAEALFR